MGDEQAAISLKFHPKRGSQNIKNSIQFPYNLYNIKLIYLWFLYHIYVFIQLYIKYVNAFVMLDSLCHFLFVSGHALHERCNKNILT